MLVRYITRVRRAEPAVRTRHAFFWAVGITSIAAALWAVTLPSVLRPLPGGLVASDTPRPWSSFFERAKEQLAAVGSTGEDSLPEDTSPTNTVSANALPGALELTPEALAEARARAAIEYIPSTTTATATTGTTMGTSSATGIPPSNQPRVVRIATTSRAVASTTASTIR